MTDTLAQQWHQTNLADFAASNGNRNINLNSQALKSFGLALGNQELSIATVESDYTAAGKALQMTDSEVVATLHSALKGATARAIDSHTQQSASPAPVDLKLAPTYSALADYAEAHGVPESAFLKANWELGTHDERPCFIVPHEDRIKRARFIDGNNPKWKPIGKNIKPCWYGFKSAVSMAVASEHKTIVITNGQPSVIAAQYHGVPALAQTDGEGKLLQAALLKRLQTALDAHGLKVCLVYDGDKAGRDATVQKTKQLKANGIIPSVVMFGGDSGFDLADYCKKAQSNSLKWLLKLAAYSRRDIEVVVTGRTMAAEFEQSLLFPTKHMPPGEMVITPMKQLHRLGGFAKMLQPGIMTEIIAPSGGGKTSFMETWVDEFRKRGLHTLWYSPEWSPRVMHLRAIQRHGGINADVYWDNVLWNKEIELGIAEGQREGKPLSLQSDAGKSALKINEIIRKWPGEIHCFQSPAVTETILEHMTERLQYLRRCNVRVGVAFFDYAQLLRTKEIEPSKNSYELIVALVKTWCQDNWIHGVMGSQVTKELARACIDRGRLLGKYDSTWVAPNEFGSILSLNIVYDGKDVKTGEPLKTNKAKINVCKNNTGQEDVVRMVTDFPRLRWLDKKW